MLPSGTSVMGHSGLTISLFSRSTSAIRFADSIDIESITIIIDTIIKLISICAPYVRSAENPGMSRSAPLVLIIRREPKKQTISISALKQNCISGLLSASIFSAFVNPSLTSSEAFENFALS